MARFVPIPDINETLRVEDIPIRRYEKMTHPASFEGHIDELTQPVNQGLCGSCWAISTSQCLRDRTLRLLGKDRDKYYIPDLSFQFIIDCAKNCVTYEGREGCALDCNGGFLSTSYKFLQSVGTPRDALFPNRHDDEDGVEHINGIRGVRGACPDAIPEDEPVFKCSAFYNVHIYPDMFGITNARIPPRLRSVSDLKRNADNIAEEIFRNGSVAVCFNLYSDFKDFWLHPNSKNMVYEIGWQLPESVRASIPAVGNVNWSSASDGMYGIHFKTGHSVSIVGYGSMQTENGVVDYWVCRNSWARPANTYKNGFFRIRRGINCSAIEADVCACEVTELPPLIKIKAALQKSGMLHNSGVSLTTSSCASTPRSSGSKMLAVVVIMLIAVMLFYALTPSRASQSPSYLQWRL